MYLLDTNIISELMRQRPHPGVLAWVRFREAAMRDTPLRWRVSVITVDEIMFGLSRRATAALMPALLTWFEGFVSRHDVLPVTPAIAWRAGQLRAALEGRGQPRTQADMLIAATAQVHSLTVVTRNLRDFEGCGVGLLDPFQDPQTTP